MKKTTPLAASALLIFNILSPALSHAGPPNTSFIHPRHAAAPAAPSTTAAYANCQSYVQEGQNYDPNNAKSVATARMNGALYTGMEMGTVDYKARATCVQLAIQNGADVNYTDAMLGDTPLTEAISDSSSGSINEAAALALIKAGAKVNVSVKGLIDPTQSRTLFHVACESYDEPVIQAMLAAGADPVANEPLDWAARTGDDAAVIAILATKKVPVNQLVSWGSNDDGQTALDASEQDLFSINAYLTQFPAGQVPADAAAKAQQISDKETAVSQILASFANHYKTPADADMDSFVAMLQQKQQRISAALKAAGWTCHQPNCGNPVPAPADQNADASPSDVSDGQVSTP